MLLYADVLIWLVPILIAALSPFIAKVSRTATFALSIVGVGFSLVCAVSMIPDILQGYVMYTPNGGVLGEVPFEHVFVWLNLTSIIGASINIGLLVDSLSVFMVNVISFVALWIFVFSVYYMGEEVDIGRYWFWMNLFVGSMILLVLSNNLIQLFIAWELVGLCSWALISFWYKSTNPSPDPKFATEGEYNAHCGFKALVTTGFADTFFLVAILLIGWATWKTYGAPIFSFKQLMADPNFRWVGELAKIGLMPIFTLFILSGPFGKSAQFPYHEWLPEAMAGPTTVSALIHAATMVKAGVYFVARFFPIMLEASHQYPQAKMFFIIVAYVGAFTAFLAASQGMVAKELKKVLAYSTISQLGYMFLALGVAGLIHHYEHAYLYGLYHLASHAVFKALLFLAAGAVLHTVHTKYLNEMGGLAKYMPITFWTMLMGALSLIGVPPFSGAFSKEGIIASVYELGDTVLLALAVITVALTAFYTIRMLGYVFFGHESEHVRHIINEHGIREESIAMILPLIILAVSTIILSFMGPAILEFIESGSLIHAFEPYMLLEYFTETFKSRMFYISGALIILGALPSYYAFVKKTIDVEKIVNQNVIVRALWKFLYNRWYINKLYYLIFLDGLKRVSQVIRKVQTGISNVNVAYAVVGIVVILVLILL
ncbi:MAG: NADH-quinone oxidoreductase subunit 5 family protein [Candidatus Njordarchaeales archaeon]